MNALQLAGGARALEAKSDPRQKAEQTAGQFEAILVRQLVGSLRQSSMIGEDGGLFGSGTGSDTYADWFDQHVADHIGSARQLGIKETILRDIERSGQIRAADPADMASRKAHNDLADQSRFAALAANHAQMLAATSRRGGIDVTQ